MGLYDQALASNAQGQSQALQLRQQALGQPTAVERFMSGLMAGRDRLMQQQQMEQQRLTSDANRKAKADELKAKVFKTTWDVVKGAGNTVDPSKLGPMIANFVPEGQEFIPEALQAVSTQGGMGGQYELGQRKQATDDVYKGQLGQESIARQQATNAKLDPQIAEIEARTRLIERNAQKPFTVNVNSGAIPGSANWERLRKAGEAGQQKEVSLKGATTDLDRLKAEALRLKTHPGLSRITGLMGVAPNMPGGDAANAAAQMETLKSQIAFNVLQSLRSMSKTGGALGQVSDKEEAMLSNNLAALQTSQSTESFAQALDRIVDYVDGAKARLQSAYGMDIGGEGLQPAEAQPNKLKKLLTPKAKVQTTVKDGKTYYMWSDGNWHTKAPQ